MRSKRTELHCPCLGLAHSYYDIVVNIWGIPGPRTNYGGLSNFVGRPAFRGRKARPTARSSQGFRDSRHARILGVWEI